MLRPNASLLRIEPWRALTPEQCRGFPPLCPDLVDELASNTGASPSDAGPRGTAALRHKLDIYQANGARLGCLLLPHDRAVATCRAGVPGWPNG